MRPDHSKLGANVGFGYLTDDDDDDATGGAGADEFDALVSGASAADPGDIVSVSVTAAPTGGAQTNGAFRVYVIPEAGASATLPDITDADGWSNTGWTWTGGAYYCDFTKASVVASATILIDVSSSTPGDVEIRTNAAPLPQTDQASGSGNAHIVVFGGAATFAAIVALDGASLFGDFHVDITTGGEAQTNAQVVLAFYGSFNNSFTTIDLDGWSEVGWFTPGSGTPAFTYGSPPPRWVNILTRTSVAVGTTSPTWTMVDIGGGGYSGMAWTLQSFIDASPTDTDPQTDQVPNGDCNTISGTLT